MNPPHAKGKHLLKFYLTYRVEVEGYISFDWEREYICISNGDIWFKLLGKWVKRPIREIERVIHSEGSIHRVIIKIRSMENSKYPINLILSAPKELLGHFFKSLSKKYENKGILGEDERRYDNPFKEMIKISLPLYLPRNPL